MKFTPSAVFPVVLARWLVALLVISAGSAVSLGAQLAFDIRIEHGRIPDNMRLIRVREGDVVTLRWTTDQPLVLHLHGYDIEQRVAPGSVAELAFTAYATGRFPIEIHAPAARAAGPAHEEAPLVVIEVYPR